jgi:hypothetical protein
MRLAPPAARADHEQVIVGVRDAHQDAARLPPDHHGLDRHPGRGPAEGQVKRVPQPLPRGIFPDLTQVQGRAAAISEFTAWRRPDKHGNQR